MLLAIRTMQEADIAVGLKLCRLAGWNQVEDDWRRLMTHSPDGVFVAEYKGQPCATACATPYGSSTAWIGMVLVHPDFRRREIGSSLIRHCVAFLKTKGVERIRIDASDQGRPVYLKLGFDDERPVHSYVGTRPAGLEIPSQVNGTVSASQWPEIAQRDAAAFGADRLRLLNLLGAQALSAVVATSSGVAGYGFARTGHLASVVGPVVAIDSVVARQIVQALLAQLPEGEIYWYVLPDNLAAKALAASYGFTLRRRFTRMCLGTPSNQEDLSLIYGNAGLELG